MGYLCFNLTPPLYIVFNMLLTSHFDLIPAQVPFYNYLSGIESNDGVNDYAFTENMGLLNNCNTILIYVNLVNGVLLILMMFVTFTIFKILILIPYHPKLM